MMSADRLLAFAAMSFWLRVMPGPSVLFVIGRALTQGRRAASTTVVGNTLGACVLIVAVAFEVGVVVERSVLVFAVLELAGAAYLVSASRHGVSVGRCRQRSPGGPRRVVCGRFGRGSQSA